MTEPLDPTPVDAHSFDAADEPVSPTADESGAASADSAQSPSAQAVSLQQGMRESIGGVRGLFDSGFPSLVFVAAWLLTDHNLQVSLGCAVGAGVIVAVIRLVLKQKLQQVISGFFGIALSAFIAHRTHRASNFFLPGIIINAVYLVALLVSVAVRRPLIGYVSGVFNDNFNWRSHPNQRRAAFQATWLWISIFALKLAVQVPLLNADKTAALGIAKFVMGYPLFILGGWLTWRMVRKSTSHL